MCGVSLLARTCRVCLASSGEMYRLANTALEETYERVTSGTLVVEGRPCCVCGVCLSALRRCRRFIDTAREANDALDRYQPNTDTVKLTERPLFTFTQTPIEIFDSNCHEGIWESRGKMESDSADNEDNKIICQQNEYNPDDGGNIVKEEIKEEVTSDVENDTQISDNIVGCTSEVVPGFECINIQQKMIDIEIYATALDDVKHNISEVLDNVEGDTAPGTSSVGSPRSRKRVKLNEDTKSGPALKKRRPITSEHRRGNTDPAAALHSLVDSFPYREFKYETPKQNTFKQSLKIRTDLLKPFACDKCDYRSHWKHGLKRHITSHTDEKPFACDQCDFKCFQEANLKQHSMVHYPKIPYKNDEKVFACDHCDYKCSFKGNLKSHVKRHTGEKPFSCNFCDYKCIQKATLIRHMRRHTGEKPFSCDKCDYKCVSKAVLNEHLLKHTGKMPFSCDMCDYQCTKNSSLIAHLRIHTGERPFSCDKCDYRSRHKGGIVQHLKTHTGDKPFMCHMCDFKSEWHSNLKRHLREHSGEKPFACDQCKYRCNQVSGLKQHMLKHTGEKRFMCDRCDYKCNDKRALRKHIVKAHDGSGGTDVP